MKTLSAALRDRFEYELERKAAAPVTVAPATSEFIEGVVPGPALPLRLRSIIPPGRTTGSAISYVRETSITSSPVVPVGPGGLKQQAGLTYETVVGPVATIPAFLKISAQVWEDFAMFRSWVDTRMRYALAQAEEKQLLNGSGVAPNLQGLMLVAIAIGTPAASLLAGVGAGLAAVYGYGYIADGIVLNPTDWGKAITAGGYVVGSPGILGGPPSLWGIPVVLSPAMASGSYLVGQFTPYCQIFDREDAAVDVAEENQDDFVRDLITVRAEERLAFAIYQPGAFSKGTFTP